MKIIKKLSLSNILILIALLTASCELKISGTFGDNYSYPDSKRNAVLRQIIPPKIPEKTISILDFGALPDSITDCKPAFDKAIKSCIPNEETRIIVPPGVYMIEGPIHLASNICMDLQKGARLKFSNNPEKYLPTVLTSWEGTMLYNYSPFIYGYNLQNVSIIGEGIIDGNASETFAKWPDLDNKDQQLSRDMNHNNTPLEKRNFGKGHYLRPQLIQLLGCKNILIEGITILDSPFWCLHLLKSENITVRNIKFHAFNKNNDGIDPEYSKNILIEGVVFDNADDNIAIKAGRDHEGRLTQMPSENIVIRNCIFKGLHAVVIGSEMSSGVQNIFVEDCKSGGYLKRGIYLKSNPDRGGFIRNIYVKNVSFGEVEDCFYITSHYHGEGKGFATEIHDVYVDSMTCKKAKASALVIQGFAEKKVHDIYFTDIRVDTAINALSFTQTKNIVLNNVVIGDEVTVPSNVK
jgi:polygalacturonase